MPRIRTIKPEFCTSGQIAECSTSARLLFVCLWCFCDDAGRHVDDPRRIKMECFPGDAFTKDEMIAMIDELCAQGLLIRYEYENQAFLQVTGWHHQRIDRPSYKHGPLKKNEDGRDIPMPLDEYAASIRRPFDEGSTSPHPRKGMEGKGKDIKTPPTPPNPSTSEQRPEAETKKAGGAGEIKIPPKLDTPRFRDALARWQAVICSEKGRADPVMLETNIGLLANYTEPKAVGYVLCWAGTGRFTPNWSADPTPYMPAGPPAPDPTKPAKVHKPKIRATAGSVKDA